MGNRGRCHGRNQAERPAGARRPPRGEQPYRTERPGGRRRWPRLAQAGSLAVAAVSLIVLAAACSGGGGGNSGASGGSSQSGSSEHASLLAYAQCMRAHGISKFPDPTPEGGIGLPDGVNPQSPQFLAADKACKHLTPAGHPMSAAQRAKIKAGNLRYAQCMRAHGISDMPDPAADGSLQVQVSPGGDLDPSNPRFQSADKACKHFQYIPPGSDGPSLSGNTTGGGS